VDRVVDRQEPLETERGKAILDFSFQNAASSLIKPDAGKTTTHICEYLLTSQKQRLLLRYMFVWQLYSWVWILSVREEHERTSPLTFSPASSQLSFRQTMAIKIIDLFVMRITASPLYSHQKAEQSLRQEICYLAIKHS
jgi:hypothetical protein